MLDNETMGVLGLVVLLILMMLRMPVGFAMALVGFVGVALVKGPGAAIGVLKSVPHSTVASYGMSVVPMFIFMGELAFHGGMTTTLYAGAYRIIGRLRGGLSMATIAASGVFSAISGSSVASAAAMGKVAIPDMRKYGYDGALSAASVCAGGSLGNVIPPSIIAVIYGILTEQSIGKILVALVVPGIILMILYMITAYLVALCRPGWAPRGKRHNAREKALGIVSVSPILFIFVLVIGGIFFGIFTVTEAAAVGTFIVFLYGLFTRNLTWKGFVKCLLGASITSAQTFVVLIGAMTINYFFALVRLPMILADFVGGIGAAPVVVFLCIMAAYFVLGACMDSMSVLTLTVPIIFPVVINLGFDPIWFGVMMVVFIEEALITPPVGMVLFVAKTMVEDVRMERLYWAVAPYVVAICIFQALLLFFPGLSLWLLQSM
ncbi:MAG: TRAP transporter large permease [Thermodesulfobacteriota bacterium]